MPFLNLDELETREPVPGWKVHFVHSETMTFAHWTVEAGAVMPAHSHPHEQVANTIEGECELTIGGETRIIRPGVVAVIPPNAVHCGKALTRCRIVDAFYPIREDYR